MIAHGQPGGAIVMILGADDLALGPGVVGGNQFLLAVILSDHVHQLGKTVLVDVAPVGTEDRESYGA